MADKFFDAMFTASVLGGSSGPAPVIVAKNITANGTYSALDDQADGYNPVVVDVPNTYTASDEGKVVSGGALVAQTSTTATANGTIDTTTNNQVVVNVPNTYTTGDEGKVVSGGQLVAQTSTTATVNGTINTTTNNEVVVNVPNTYTAGDEGKVVSSGQLVAQTAYPSTITTNNTYDTTNYNSITVNVSSMSTSASAELYSTSTYETQVRLCLSICNGKAILSGIESLNTAGKTFYIDPDDLLLSDFFNVNEKIITGHARSSSGLSTVTCTLDIAQNYIFVKAGSTSTSGYIYCDNQ